MSFAKYQRIIDASQGTEAAYLTDEEEAEKALCESSLYEFAKCAWTVSEGGKFIDTWHLHGLAEHLEALYYMTIKDLLVNMPFRSGKSMFCSVFFPVWVFIKDPSQSFLCSSYGQELAKRDSLKCRRLIESDWFKKYWGDRVKLRADERNKLSFMLTGGGYRLTSSIDGAGTGFGANFLAAGDPNNVKEVKSAVTRANINNWWDEVMPSRFRLAADRRRLVDQQRSHEGDLSGHILAKDDPSWVHFCLPEEFEPDRRCVTVKLPSMNGKVWRDPRKKEGELLAPAIRNAEALAQLKKDFNNDSYIIAGQLQQRPSPASGGILKKEWFRLWKERHTPEFEYILQSWDTALTGNSDSAYSACTTWGVFKDRGDIRNLMLLSVFHEQIEYPDLRKMATRLANNYEDTDMEDPLYGVDKPDLILIEAKVSGYSLHADLMRAGLPVMKFNPNKYGDKENRCRLVSHLMENGLVWLQTESPKHEYLTREAQLFLKDATIFPNGASMDIIDSMSQALIRLTEGGYLMNKEDPVPQQQEAWANDTRKYW